MRYIWDMYSSYLREMPPIGRFFFALTTHKMRQWDYASAARVDQFVCNSQYVAARIRKFYRRSSEVIHPPVTVRSVHLQDRHEDFYLAVGRLVNYKRFDLAISACNQLRRPLKVIGSGPDIHRLKGLAGPNIQFLGAISDSQKHDLLGKCRALLFPGEEDFGIVPVEAQAHGRPVIAFEAGGAMETVKGLEEDDQMAAGPTGVFFADQTVDSLVAAMERFEKYSYRFDPETIRAHAMQFDESIFRHKIIDFLEQQVREARVQACHTVNRM